MNETNVCKNGIHGNLIDESFQMILNGFKESGNISNMNIHFNPCEFCKSTQLGSANMNNAVSRLLNVRACIRNICPGKELTVGCFIVDNNEKPIAFQSQTFTVGTGNNSATCDNVCSGNLDPCISVNRNFSFLLPKGDICSALDVQVKLIANYTSPCTTSV